MASSQRTVEVEPAATVILLAAARPARPALLALADLILSPVRRTGWIRLDVEPQTGTSG